MKHLVNDQFDDISVAITNNAQDMNLDIINTHWKILQPATLILPSTKTFSNSSQIRW